MNRDEALSHTKKQYTQELSKEDLVNKIYDDLENQTCESCKYNFDDEKDLNHCGHPSDEMMAISYTPLKFGCNKWESNG